MRSIIDRRISRLAGFALGFLALVLPTSAQASALLLFGPLGAQSSVFLLGSGSLCVGFTYDVNGNRTAQTVSTIGSGSVLWGAGTYGCFVWDQ